MDNLRYLNNILVGSLASAYIVGGAVRDTALGIKEPKDYDIAVSKEDEQTLISYLVGQGFSVAPRVDFTASTDEPGVEFADKWSNWTPLTILRNGELLCIDVLTVASGIEVLDVTAQFDYNINQWLFDGYYCVFTGDYKTFGTLTQIGDPSEDRKAYIRELADIAGWEHGSPKARVVEESTAPGCRSTFPHVPQ